MSTIGTSELIVIALIVLVLFGTPVLTFVLGYVIGRRSSSTTHEGPIAGGSTTAPEESSR